MQISLLMLVIAILLLLLIINSLYRGLIHKIWYSCELYYSFLDKTAVTFNSFATFGLIIYAIVLFFIYMHETIIIIF